MTKPKRKSKQAWWQHLWDEYVLFKRPFFYVSPLTLERCVTRIDSILDDDPIFGFPKVQAQVFEQSTFIIKALEHRHHNEIAAIIGGISTKDGYTIISGESLMRSMGGIALIFIVGGVIAVAVSVIRVDAVYVLGFLAVMAAMALIQFQGASRDRDYLLRYLERAVGIEREDT